MRYIGSHPGAYSFRFLMIIILMTALIVFFFNYTDDIAVTTEEASIQQTINIINSSMAVIFASYAVNGQLDRLNELNGGNPFEYMAEFNLVPGGYVGEVELGDLANIESGWYFDTLSKKVFYKAFYSSKVFYFALVLKFRDLDGSGRFESAQDEYQRLYFEQLPQQ